MQLYLNNSGSRWTSTEKQDRKFVLVDLEGNKRERLASYFFSFGNFAGVGFRFQGVNYEGLPRNSERGEIRIEGELPHIFLDTVRKVSPRSQELTLRSYFKLSRITFLRKFAQYIPQSARSEKLHYQKWTLLHCQDFLALKQVTPNIKTTFATITPESAEQGDYNSRGWVDSEGKDFPRSDEDYLQDAIDFLRREGVSEASCSYFGTGIWYTAYLGTTDYSTGEETEQSYHLYCFTEEEERTIYKALFPNR